MPTELCILKSMFMLRLISQIKLTYIEEILEEMDTSSILNSSGYRLANTYPNLSRFGLS